MASSPRSLRLPRNCRQKPFLAVAYGNAEHLAVAEGIDADRHHHGPRHHLQVAAEAAVEVDGIEVDVGEADMVQRSAQKGLHLLIEPLADAAHLRFGDAARPAQRLDKGFDLAGRDVAGVGLHHHGVEGLVEPPTRLSPDGKEAALPEFGVGAGEIAHLGGEQPFAIAISMARSHTRAAFMTLSTDRGRDLGVMSQQVGQLTTKYEAATG